MDVLIVNRLARKFARAPSLVERVRAAAPGLRVLVTSSLDELTAAAHEARALSPSAVLLCGGDGTYSLGLTALSRAWGDAPLPRVALLPGGTVSTIARNLGTHGDPVVRVAELLRGLADGSARERPLRTLRANGRLGCIFGAALVGSFFERYYADGAAGYLDAARMVARIFAGSFVGGAYARSVLDPIEATLSVDGVAVPMQRFSLLCCATVLDLGLHMHVSYRCHEPGDALHLIASGLPTAQLGPQLGRVLRGKRLRGEPHFDERVGRFEVLFGRSRPWVLDGELLHDERVCVEPGPTLRVLTA